MRLRHPANSPHFSPFPGEIGMALAKAEAEEHAQWLECSGSCWPNSYLPAGGTNGALTTSLIDPTSTSAGHLGGEILASQLNTDLGTSGLQVNGNTVSNFGNLLVCGTGTPPPPCGLGPRKAA
jgi:hypothetical protein